MRGGAWLACGPRGCSTSDVRWVWGGPSAQTPPSPGGRSTSGDCPAPGPVLAMAPSWQSQPPPRQGTPAAGGGGCTHPHPCTHSCVRMAHVHAHPHVHPQTDTSTSCGTAHVRVDAQRTTPGAGQTPTRFPLRGSPPHQHASSCLRYPHSHQLPSHTPALARSRMLPPLSLQPAVPGSAWLGDNNQSKHLSPAPPAPCPARPAAAHLAGRGVPG